MTPEEDRAYRLAFRALAWFTIANNLAVLI